MKKFEKMSKENLISELMQDTVKGGCCIPTTATTIKSLTLDSVADELIIIQK